MSANFEAVPLAHDLFRHPYSFPPAAARLVSKKAVRMPPHSSASNPDCVGRWWLSQGSEGTSMRDPQAPALGSVAPYTTSPMRESTSAPVHMMQGSRVTYIVQSERRHDPTVPEAAPMARISACAVASCKRSV